MHTLQIYIGWIALSGSSLYIILYIIADVCCSVVKRCQKITIPLLSWDLQQEYLSCLLSSSYLFLAQSQFSSSEAGQAVGAVCGQRSSFSTILALPGKHGKNGAPGVPGPKGEAGVNGNRWRVGTSQPTGTSWCTRVRWQKWVRWQYWSTWYST